MIMQVDEYFFRHLFKDYNRESNFSYEALTALYDYLNDIEDYEVDVIAICCEYSEYKTIADFNKEWSLSCNTIYDIEYYTLVIPFASGFIVRCF